MPVARHLFLDESGNVDTPHVALRVAGWAAYRPLPHEVDVGLAPAPADQQGVWA